MLLICVEIITSANSGKLWCKSPNYLNIIKSPVKLFMGDEISIYSNIIFSRVECYITPTNFVSRKLSKLIASTVIWKDEVKVE